MTKTALAEAGTTYVIVPTMRRWYMWCEKNNKNPKSRQFVTLSSAPNSDRKLRGRKWQEGDDLIQVDVALMRNDTYSRIIYYLRNIGAPI